MVDEKETPKTPKETAEGKQPVGDTAPAFLIIVPFVIIALCSLSYLFTSYQAKVDNNATTLVQTPAEPSINTTETEPEARKNASVAVTRLIKPQPNCTAEEHIKDTLKEIWTELHISKEMCTPEDVHNLKKHLVPNLASNNNKVAEPRGHFVIYIAVGLLLTSLAAAFLDVYKVKGRPSKTKPQLTKRCSLADLTVLRHSRRESMRRDSMADEHRPPLKLLGARPPPEHRRCSCPIYPGDISYGHISPRQGSRKASLDVYDDNSYYDHHNRVVRMIRRF